MGIQHLRAPSQPNAARVVSCVGGPPARQTMRATVCKKRRYRKGRSQRHLCLPFPFPSVTGPALPAKNRPTEPLWQRPRNMA